MDFEELHGSAKLFTNNSIENIIEDYTVSADGNISAGDFYDRTSLFF